MNPEKLFAQDRLFIYGKCRSAENTVKNRKAAYVTSNVKKKKKHRVQRNSNRPIRDPDNADFINARNSITARQTRSPFSPPEDRKRGRGRAGDLSYNDFIPARARARAGASTQIEGGNVLFSRSNALATATGEIAFPSLKGLMETKGVARDTDSWVRLPHRQCKQH